MSRATYYNLGFRTRSSKGTKIRPPKKINFKLPHQHCNDCVSQIVNSILENARRVKNDARNQNCTNLDMCKILDEVIPNNYFGIIRHRKLFYKITKKILTQSNGEYTYKSLLVKGYFFEAIPWLEKAVKNPEIDCSELLLKVNTFLLENVVKSLVRHFYKIVRTYKHHEVLFISRHLHQQFETRVFNELLSKGHLTYEESCSIKNKSRGILRIVPKGRWNSKSGRYRPIVNAKTNEIYRKRCKALNKKLYTFCRSQTPYFSKNLYEMWGEFVDRIQDQKLYGVKVDVEDAYGNVDINLLSTIIKNLPHLCQGEKDFIINHVQEQIVSFGFCQNRKMSWKWNHGLIQGDRMSSSLCELYMSYQDSIYLQDFLNNNCFLHRTVDDYFFCSTERHEVYSFLDLIKSIHTINAQKTMTNVPLHNEIVLTDEIEYCGKIFDLTSRHVQKSYKYGPNFVLRHNFKIWNNKVHIPEIRVAYFIRRNMDFSFHNHCFSKFEVNTKFNDEQTVLRNVFNGMVFIALKFDHVFVSVKSVNEQRHDFVESYFDELKKLIKLYATKVFKSISKHKGQLSSNVITYKMILNLVYKAFIVVFKRRNEVYRDFIGEVESKVNLKLNLRGSGIEVGYFNKLPKMFHSVNMNRKFVPLV